MGDCGTPGGGVAESSRFRGEWACTFDFSPRMPDAPGFNVSLGERPRGPDLLSNNARRLRVCAASNVYGLAHS